MTAAQYPPDGPLIIEQGATFSLALQLSTGGPVADGGTAIDITGAEVRMQIRRSIRSTTPYFDLVSDTTVGQTGIHIDDAVEGQFTVTIDATDTAAATWTSGVFDLEVEYAGGVVKRYLYNDRVKVSKETTR